MTRARVALALLAAVAMTSLAPRDAAAQLAGARPLPTSRPTGGAVDHFKEAVDLFGRGEIVAACRKFEQSYAEDAAPGTLYNLAQCHEREGRIADAYREYDALASLAESAKLADKAASVRARASALLPRLGRVDLVHRSDAVSGISGLTIDGTPFAVDVSKKPLYLAPGAHVIGIQHADGVTVTRRIDAIAAGESRRVEMEDPAPAQPKASAPRVVRQEVVVNRKRRTAAYVVGASGAVLAATTYAAARRPPGGRGEPQATHGRVRRGRQRGGAGGRRSGAGRAHPRREEQVPDPLRRERQGLSARGRAEGLRRPLRREDRGHALHRGLRRRRCGPGGVGVPVRDVTRGTLRQDRARDRAFE
jgi:hypothetical protein